MCVLFLKVPLRSVPHHRDYHATRSGTTNLDQEYFERLRTSFYHARKYRHKLPYYHPIMTAAEESGLPSPPSETFDFTARRGFTFSPPPQSPPRNQRATSPRFFYQKEYTSSTESNRNQNQKNSAHSSIAKRNEYVSKIYLIDFNCFSFAKLFKNVSTELNELQNEWEQERIKSIVYDYVQATVKFV